MAMQQPSSWIISLESYDHPSETRQKSHVSPRRVVEIQGRGFRGGEGVACVGSEEVEVVSFTILSLANCQKKVGSRRITVKMDRMSDRRSICCLLNDPEYPLRGVSDRLWSELGDGGGYTAFIPLTS